MLCSYDDANCAGNKADSKSTSGYVFQLGENSGMVKPEAVNDGIVIHGG